VTPDTDCAMVTVPEGWPSGNITHVNLPRLVLTPERGFLFARASTAVSLACVTHPQESHYGADAGWLASRHSRVFSSFELAPLGQRS
jgi:hypothetical protein